MCGAVTSKNTDKPIMDNEAKDNKPSDQKPARRPSITINDDLTDLASLSISPTDTTGCGGNATGSGRTKVALKPGHSLMDWLKLCAKTPDLAGTGGQLRAVTIDELSKHNTLEDCWLCIRGKVYNVTPYLEFHPGGVDEMMRGAGTDATDLFNEIHRYVNYESMLKKCFIGPLAID